jgi:RNA polymerase sigma-70 factor (ECF subfamily)
MADLARGENRSLGELYRRHGDVVFRFICRLLAGEPAAQAEDLCQEVFLAIAGAARRYQDQGRFRSWALGIAARTTRSWQRRRWLSARILGRFGGSGLGMAAPTEGGPEASVACREGVAVALARLTPDQRAVFLLRTAEGMTGEEIAAALGISVNAVWQRLKRAHQVAEEAAREAGIFSQEGADP